MRRIYMAMAACCAVLATVLTGPAPAHAAPGSEYTGWRYAMGYVHASEAPDWCLDNNIQFRSGSVMVVKPCKIDWVPQYWYVCERGGGGWISEQPVAYSTTRIGQIGRIDNRVKLVDKARYKTWHVVIIFTSVHNAYFIYDRVLGGGKLMSVPPPNRLSRRGSTVTWNTGRGFKPKSQIWDLPVFENAGPGGAGQYCHTGA